MQEFYFLNILKKLKISIILGIMFLTALIQLGNTIAVSAYHPGVLAPGCDSFGHDAITLEALNVLNSDGYRYIYREFTYWGGFEGVCYGSTYADFYDAGNNYHFHDPYDHSYNGDSYVKYHFDAAVSLHNNGDYVGSFIEFGKALHVVQDATSPHHSRGQGLKADDSNGHERYELYVDTLSNYIASIDSNYNGLYSFNTNTLFSHSSSVSGWDSSDPQAFLDYGAHVSYDYYHYVDGGPNDGDNNYLAAATPLLALAVRLSAGLMKLFADNIQPRFFDLSIYVEYLKVDNDWKDVILGVNKDGSHGEFYINTACRRWTTVWDYESSYGPTHGFGYYVVNAGTYYKYDKEDSGDQLLYEALRIHYTSEECQSGTNQLKITLREYDGTNYETIIGYRDFTIPNKPGTYHSPSSTSPHYEMSGSSNELKFYLVVS
jgi:hypothetical protein